MKASSKEDKTDLLSELVGKLKTGEDEEEEEDLNYDIENVTSEMIRITVEEENKGCYDINY